MAVATEKKKTRTQLNVWVDKEARINLNRILDGSEVETQAEAVELALRLAAKFLSKKERKDAE